MASTSLEKIEKPRFFKIIADDSMDQHKLEIPRDFVQNYGDDLSSPVKLKVPGGLEWKVEIVKSEGEIWLENGWREFAEYYSVLEGSFLAFEYEKSNCEFNVIIFDKTEMNRPLSSFDNGDQVRALDLGQEQVPKEPHKKMIKLEPSEETLDQYGLTGNSKESIEKKSIPKERKPRKEAAKKLTSANLSFQAKIPPACVDSGMVYVPYRLTRKMEPGTESVMLKLNNRCWSVKLIRYSEKISNLSAGWAAFVRENSLKTGDVCTFEMIDSTDPTPLFNVSVIRDSDTCLGTNGVDRETEQTTSEIPVEVSSSRKRKDKSTLSPVNSQSHKKTKRAEKGKSEQKRLCVKKPSFSNALQKSTSGNPFFQVVMTSTHLRRRGYNLNVPLHFIKNLQLGTRVARLQVDDKVWSVKLIIYPHFGKSVFSGWTKFAMDNSLEVGDVCSFEMIDLQNLQIKVSISRDSK